jgi:hypothetical protein
MFEIDIDETIASGAKAFADYYLAQLGLERDEQVLSRITTYEEVMCLPALVAYCRASATNMTHFEAIQKQARHCPEVFERFEVIPGALENTQYLAELGVVRYNTVRPPEIQEATRQWLATNGFVNAGTVVFSRSSMHKLLQISEDEGASILIDDRYTQVLHAFEQIASGDQHIADLLKQRLTLFAFGVSEIPAQHTGLLNIVALPSWQQLKERINP